MSEIPIPSGEVKENELKLAVNLVQQLAVDEWHPEQYKDDVHERVLELITNKIEGEDITQAPEEQPATQIIDLMAALKASLEKSSAASSSADDDEGDEQQETPARKGAKKAAADKPAKKATRKKTG
jgi:DNA end-binding protein Ku